MDRLGYTALRRAGRRLGRAGDDQDRRRSTPSTARPSISTWRSVRRPRATAPLTDEEQADLAAMQLLREGGVGLRQRAGDQASDPRCRAQRLAGRPAGLDRGEVPHLERLRRTSGELLHPRADADQRHAVLGDADECILGPPVLGEQAQWLVGAALPFVDVPTGVARYPKEILRWPRSWVERQYNVVHWAVMERGGHFAAMEQPDLFVEDLRTFFRTVR